jgi:hypothetical protein
MSTILVFSFLLGEIIAKNPHSLEITWQAIMFWGTKQVYYEAHARRCFPCVQFLGQ